MNRCRAQRKFNGHYGTIQCDLEEHASRYHRNELWEKTWVEGERTRKRRLVMEARIAAHIAKAARDVAAREG